MVELGDVPVHSLVPEPLRDIASADEFMAALPQYDADMAARLEEASAAGECLRFVGALRSLPSLASPPVASHCMVSAMLALLACTSIQRFLCGKAWEVCQQEGGFVLSPETVLVCA